MKVTVIGGFPLYIYKGKLLHILYEKDKNELLKMLSTYFYEGKMTLNGVIKE